MKYFRLLLMVILLGTVLCLQAQEKSSQMNKEDFGGRNSKIAEKASDPDDLVDQARLEAEKGEKVKAIETLKRYVDGGMMGFYHRRSQIIVIPEFSILQDNPDFQVLMTETEETLKKQEEQLRKLMKEPFKEESALSLNEIRDAAEIYKKVKDVKSGEEMNEQLESADNKIIPALAKYKNEVFALLNQGRGYPYYRLTLARMLLDRKDKELSAKVIAEIKDDDFSAFPTQLFDLTRLIAIEDPKAARPCLMKLLSLSEGNLNLPQHALGIDVDMMLIIAFGIVEKDYTEELYQIVMKGNPVEKDNALSVLSAFQDDRVTTILIEKLKAEKDSAKRMKLIRMLCSIQSSASKSFLKDFSDRSKNDKEREIIKTYLEYEEQYAGDLFPQETGISIQNPKMKEILFNNLLMTNGADVSFIKKSIYLTAQKSDKEVLRSIRSRIMRRLSDEAFYDWRTITQIMNRLK